jgi:hypothetical protein
VDCGGYRLGASSTLHTHPVAVIDHKAIASPSAILQFYRVV